MIKCTVCCDVCGQPIPTYIEETPFGPVEVIETGKTKVWDLGSHFTLCKRCALLVDDELELFRMRVLNNETNAGFSVPAQKGTKRHKKAL